MSTYAQIGARRASLDIAVQIIGRIGNLALGVVVTLVIVRTLGARGFGDWSAIFAVSQIAANFGELGLAQVAVSRAASQPEDESQWLGALFSLRLALAVPITVATAIAVLFIAPTSDSRVAGLLIACVLLFGAPSAMSAAFQLRVRNDISIAIMTLNSVIWTAAALVISVSSGGIVAFAVALLATSALTSAVTLVTARRIVAIHLRGTHKYWGLLMRVGLSVGAAGILVTLYVKLDQVLVLEFAGSREAGLYGAAYRILDQIQFIPASVMTTLFPLIAAAYPANRDRVRQLFQTTGEYLAMVSLPTLIFTIIAARPIMELLFGKQFAAAAPALPVLMGAFVSISFGYLIGNMVVILSLQRKFLRTAAVGLLLNAILNVLLIPRYGFMAAAWITLLTEVTVMSTTMRQTLRALHMKPSFGRLGRVLVAALLMGLVTWGAQVVGVPLGGLIAIALASYLPGLILLHALIPGELKVILRKE